MRVYIRSFENMQWNIVFVGAGWAWLSNLVWILWDLWFHNLIWIDEQESQITKQLSNKWVQILKHWKYQVKSDDVVIYSAAAKWSPEVLKAFEIKKTEHKPFLIWDYFQFLWEITKYFKSIWFIGTNWKSSSSAMWIHVASHCLPNFAIWIVWALVPDFWGKSYMLNLEHKDELKNIFDYIFTWKKLDYSLVKKYYFLLESCEYQRHFLNLNLDEAIITSLELEHTDYFRDREDYQSAFLEMIEKTKDCVYCLEDLNSGKILKSDKIRITKRQHFDMNFVWWEHQQWNASLVYDLLQWLMKTEWISESESDLEIREYLKSFKWIWRRMEFLKTCENWVEIFSDYGHVASSIELWYKALRERYPDKKIICIFQPHQIHRILVWWNEFPNALKLYNESYIYDIYAARENIEDFSNEDIFKDFNLKTIEDLGNVFSKHCGNTYLKEFWEVENVIENSDWNSVIVVYSAWDIDFKLRKYLNIL